MFSLWLFFWVRFDVVEEMYLKKTSHLWICWKLSLHIFTALICSKLLFTFSQEVCDCSPALWFVSAAAEETGRSEKTSKSRLVLVFICRYSVTSTASQHITKNNGWRGGGMSRSCPCIPTLTANDSAAAPRHAGWQHAPGTYGMWGWRKGWQHHFQNMPSHPPPPTSRCHREFSVVAKWWHIIFLREDPDQYSVNRVQIDAHSNTVNMLP